VLDAILNKIREGVNGLVENTQSSSKDWTAELNDSNKTLTQVLSSLSDSSEMLEKLEEDFKIHLSKVLQDFRGKIENHKTEVCV
jgi:cell shape-determining protein MreC